MKTFQLQSDFKPTGDQPVAIKQLVEELESDQKFLTLLGVTGSGKTFTIANVIEKVNRPVLVLSHNKTLAAQLYQEFKSFFPDNLVEYFVSYYDYYQPEAYMPSSNTYIEKDLSINDEIEKLRLSATSALLSGRRDIIVVSSVSCIYGIGNPEDFNANAITVVKGQKVSLRNITNALVNALYFRVHDELQRGTFRLKGDTLDILPGYGENQYRLIFFGNEIESIETYDYSLGKKIAEPEEIIIYPASIFMTTKDKLSEALNQIYVDLGSQVKFFKDNFRYEEAKRLEDRVNYDLEMLKELGYCSGIENYSRYFDKRKAGERPFCLLDYFPQDYLMVVDESHVTIPQVRGMYGGDRSRKQVLVDYGFRLPAAMDNRPLTFNEFEHLQNQVIFVSATPGDYEMQKCEGLFIEQVIRPTGIPEPEVVVRPSANQIDDLLNEINIRIKANERVLVTTLTKRMAEELNKYLMELRIPSKYIHSDVDTLERIEILRQLRSGDISVIVGVNLLREGLDLPEVTLVAILDADKEGFLRNERSLIQTAGRAARNVKSIVILYADKITDSMKRMMEETSRRRKKQLAYNAENNITPTTVVKSLDYSLAPVGDDKKSKIYDTEDLPVVVSADPVIAYMSKEQIQKAITKLQKDMEKAAKELDFMSAARFRDEIVQLKKQL